MEGWTLYISSFLISQIVAIPVVTFVSHCQDRPEAARKKLATAVKSKANAPPKILSQHRAWKVQESTTARKASQADKQAAKTGGLPTTHKSLQPHGQPPRIGGVPMVRDPCKMVPGYNLHVRPSHRANIKAKLDNRNRGNRSLYQNPEKLRSSALRSMESLSSSSDALCDTERTLVSSTVAAPQSHFIFPAKTFRDSFGEEEKGLYSPGRTPHSSSLDPFT